MGATGHMSLFAGKLKLTEIKYNVKISSSVILTTHPALSSQMGLVAITGTVRTENVPMARESPSGQR